MTLVVGRICVWCLVIVVMFMGFGQAGATRCGGCLKVINWGWRCKSQKEGSFHRKGRFSLCNTAVLWNFIANLTGYCKRFYWIPFFTILLLLYVFEVGKAQSVTQNVLIVLTLNGLFQKNFKFFTFPLKIPDKTKLHTKTLHIIVLHPSEILRPTTKTPGNST